MLKLHVWRAFVQFLGAFTHWFYCTIIDFKPIFEHIFATFSFCHRRAKKKEEIKKISSFRRWFFLSLGHFSLYFHFERFFSKPNRQGKRCSEKRNCALHWQFVKRTVLFFCLLLQKWSLVARVSVEFSRDCKLKLRQVSRSIRFATSTSAAKSRTNPERINNWLSENHLPFQRVRTVTKGINSNRKTHTHAVKSTSVFSAKKRKRIIKIEKLTANPFVNCCHRRRIRFNTHIIHTRCGHSAKQEKPTTTEAQHIGLGRSIETNRPTASRPSLSSYFVLDAITSFIYFRFSASFFLFHFFVSRAREEVCKRFAAIQVVFCLAY